MTEKNHPFLRKNGERMVFSPFRACKRGEVCYTHLQVLILLDEERNMKERQYILNEDGVDQISMEISRVLAEQKLERREALRIRLSMEELLLRVMEENREEPVTADLIVRKRFGTRTLLLKYGGPSFDPTQGEEDEGAWGGNRILQNLGLDPTWSWRKGENVIQVPISVRRKLGELSALLIAIVLAVVLGQFGYVLPAETVTSLDEVLLTPVFDAFLGLLTTFAGLMIFLTVSSGVFGIGDTASLNRVGKVMFPRFLLGLLAVSAVSVLLPQPFLSLETEGVAGGSSQAREISAMLFNILPKNPVQPFLDGNAMQIVVLAVFTGIILLALGEQTRHVSRLVEEACLLVQNMLRIVCKLIPIFVFVSLFRMILSGAAGMLAGMWKPAVMTVGLNVLVSVVVLILAGIRGKASPWRIFQKLIPPMVIAFSTASCMAAYPSAVNVGEYKLGVRRSLLDVGFPIGVVIYMPFVSIYFASLSLYLAELYHVEVSASWFIMAILICDILAMAVPPVPGAMLTCYGILLAQLGIPAEGLLVATTLEILMNPLSSGFIILHLSAEMVQQAADLDMLDREALRAP